MTLAPLLNNIKALNARPIRPTTQLFAEQQAFISDPAKRKLVVVPRRGGKTYPLISAALETLMDFPDDAVAFGGPTASEAWSIASPVLHKILRQCNLHDLFKVSEARQEVCRPDGRVCLEFFGVGYQRGGRTVEGKPYRLTIIDECGLIASSDLRRAIQSSIEPTLVDYDGTLILGGRPGLLTNNYFAEAIAGAHGYKVFRWSALDNPHVADNMRAHIDQLIARDPNVVNTPEFKRNYLGIACDDDTTGLVFYGHSNGCLIHDNIPSGGRHIGAISFAANLSVGVVVLDIDSRATVVYSTSLAPHTTTEQLARFLLDLASEYPALTFIGPRGRDATLMALRTKGVPINQIDTFKYVDGVAAVNNALASSALFVCHPAAESLIEQLTSLRWEQRTDGSAFISNRQPRHLADALVLTHQHLTPSPTLDPPPPDPNADIRAALLRNAGRDPFAHLRCKTLPPGLAWDKWIRRAA